MESMTFIGFYTVRKINGIGKKNNKNKTKQPKREPKFYIYAVTF